MHACVNLAGTVAQPRPGDGSGSWEPTGYEAAAAASALFNCAAAGTVTTPMLTARPTGEHTAPRGHSPYPCPHDPRAVMAWPLLAH